MLRGLRRYQGTIRVKAKKKALLDDHRKRVGGGGKERDPPKEENRQCKSGVGTAFSLKKSLREEGRKSIGTELREVRGCHRKKVVPSEVSRGRRREKDAWQRNLAIYTEGKRRKRDKSTAHERENTFGKK